MTNITPVILCGGSGTRLWPLSRKSHPKQFLKLFGNNSLLQETVLRVSHNKLFSKPILICNQEHITLVNDHMSEISLYEYEIISEPAPRGTAPAAAIAAMHLQKTNPDAIMLILSADHNILNTESFISSIEQAIPQILQDKILTFGMNPTSPETGYGYIRQGKALDASNHIYNIQNFVEKPDQETAKQYLSSGEYSWNGGIFLMQSKTYLNELKLHRPDVYEACVTAHEQAAQQEQKIILDPQSFSAIPSESIDCGVMEKTSHGAVMNVNIGWTDIGSWDMVWEINPKDTNGNVTKGDILLQECKDSYFSSQDNSLIAAYGIENLIVVKTGNATLIVPKDKAQDVKKLITELNERSRQELDNDHKVTRPWGSYEVYADAPHFKIKQIIVKPGAKLSLQSHNHRAEHWVVVKGVATVTKGKEVFELHANQSTYINKQELHRLENRSEEEVHIIEIQTGEYFGEDDIVRYEDVYGRKIHT